MSISCQCGDYLFTGKDGKQYCVWCDDRATDMSVVTAEIEEYVFEGIDEFMDDVLEFDFPDSGLDDV